ncbi:MAG: 50S ribosomal protein L10 [Pyrinomonas sp.]|uniref:50S ribosomal protein L10 n=1 Tax=Pyrinomonas sp. TaxID=2080306 RepID=UPI003333E79C
MKTRKQKQKDLERLAEQFRSATTGILVGFNKVTVEKDQSLRRRLREVGAEYHVVKNTLARLAAAGTPFEKTMDHLRGTTAVALSKSDPVALSKAVSKFLKENPETFSFKVGIVEGRVVALKDLEEIANLPSREQLISQLMFLLNSQAQRLATVLSAVPRNLAIVVKQIGEKKGEAAA